MKNLNFIHTLTAPQRHAINRWFIFSVAMLIAVCASIVIIQAQQLRDFMRVRAEKNSLAHHTSAYTACSANKQQLLEKTTILKKKLAVLDQHKNQLNTPINLLATIKNVSNQNSSLQSLNFNNNKIELVTHCANADMAIALTEKLNATSFLHNTQLMLLKPTNAQIACTITSELKT